MAGLDFVHLHVHSSFSLLEGALTIARLAELAKADHQPALALTDTDNMFGVLEFSEKLAGYSATFARKSVDSVARPGDPEAGLSEWWEGLCAARRTSTCWWRPI